MESLLWDLGVIWEAFGRHLGSIWEASGRHLGHPWGALGELWDASMATGGPEASWMRSSAKRSCFIYTYIFEMSTYVACTRREQVSQSVVKTVHLEGRTAGA